MPDETWSIKWNAGDRKWFWVELESPIHLYTSWRGAMLLYPEIDDQHIMDGGSLFRGGARGSPAAGEVLSRAKG